MAFSVAYESPIIEVNEIEIYIQTNSPMIE